MAHFISLAFPRPQQTVVVGREIGEEKAPNAAVLLVYQKEKVKVSLPLPPK